MGKVDITLRPPPPHMPPRRRNEVDYNGAPRPRGVIRISPTTADVIDDPTRVHDWDEEELRRGRRRDKNGRFTGRDPIVVPTAVYREMVRRAVRKAEVQMATNLEAASQALVKIIEDPRAENRDKIAAMKILFDRVMGKEPTTVEHNIKTPLFVGILQGGIVAGGEPVAIGPAPPDESDILDAEVIEDDELIWED